MNDTSPEADRVQIALFRAAGPTRRVALALNLSGSVLALSRRAILEANPGIDAREAALRQLELYHGRDLAQRVRAHLAALGT